MPKQQKNNIKSEENFCRSLSQDKNDINKTSFHSENININNSVGVKKKNKSIY